MKHKIQLGVVTLILLALAAFVVRDASVLAQKPISFDRDVRPILSDSCFACHGPDEKQRKARLQLDTKAGAFAKQGVIVPGKSDESRLYKRVASSDPNTIMPPVASGP